MHHSENTKHGKPNGHNRPERFPDKRTSKLLNKKKQGKYPQNNINNRPLAYVMKCRKLFQAFYSRRDRDRWSNHAVSKQGRSSQHGRDNQPLLPPPHKGIKGEYTSFSPVVRLKSKNDVLYCGLKSKGPDNQRKHSNNQFATDYLSAYSSIQNI